jgi:hypothetical protein
VSWLRGLISEASVVAAATGMLYLAAMQWEAGYQQALGFDDLSVGIDQITNFIRITLLPLLGCVAVSIIIVLLMITVNLRFMNRKIAADWTDIVALTLPVVAALAFIIPNWVVVVTYKTKVIQGWYLPFLIMYYTLEVLRYLVPWINREFRNFPGNRRISGLARAGQAVIVLAGFLMLSADLGRVAAHQIDNPEFCRVSNSPADIALSDDCQSIFREASWIVVDRRGDEILCARLTSDRSCVTQDFVRYKIPTDGQAIHFCASKLARPLRISSDYDPDDPTKGPALSLPTPSSCAMRDLRSGPLE